MAKKQTVLITGASSGIGEAFAHIFAREEYSLVLTARSKAKLVKLKKELEAEYGIAVTVVVADLAKPEAPEQIVKALGKQSISILVNNAGFGDYGLFEKSDWATQQQMIQLNITALTKLTHLLLPSMIKKKSGKILNVASVASFVPGPWMAVYFATKAFVLSFSEGLAKEVAHKGVTVTALCPGPTTSGFQKRASMGDIEILNKKLPTSEEVAQFGFERMIAGDVVAVHGTNNRMMVFFGRFLPRSILRNMVYSMQAPRKK